MCRLRWKIDKSLIDVLQKRINRPKRKIKIFTLFTLLKQMRLKTVAHPLNIVVPKTNPINCSEICSY